jgi:hypothetical protein
LTALSELIGKSPDELSLPQRRALAGKWIALEVYTPLTLPLRVMEAIGDTAADCMRQIKDRGLDPRNYEYTPLPPPY